MRENAVKAALARGEVQVGTWLHTLGMPQTIQVLATAGFDFVYIDMEHSAFSIETVAGMCAAGLHAGIVPLVRPTAHEFHLVSRPLDNGALGVLMPHVDTGEDAAAAVRSALFVPDGDRGSQPTSNHMDFAAVDVAEHMRRFNEECLVIVQIESRIALDNLDAILATPGVDGATVGRGDLAIDLGHPGERDHPEVTQAVHDTIAACRRHGKAPALLVFDPDDAATWIKAGVRMVAYSSELVLLREAARSALADVRRIRPTE
ncbi:MAG TPA: aldolase/citrate lyase family protein [Marmoricola sp.]|jgi:4-hydroxy-2-oxoheptanedioate aldolase|nr:aldolase/citrate lyase family protein [Marmoricola sp.]